MHELGSKMPDDVRRTLLPGVLDFLCSLTFVLFLISAVVETHHAKLPERPLGHHLSSQSLYVESNDDSMAELLRTGDGNKQQHETHSAHVQRENLCCLSRRLLCFLVFVSLLHAVRPLIYLSTVLPDPTCDSEKRRASAACSDNVICLLTDMFRDGCGDMIFSGHTMVAWSAWLFVRQHRYLQHRRGLSTRTFDMLSLATGLAAVAVGLGMAVTHLHYTVDVFVAVTLAELAFAAMGRRLCHWPLHRCIPTPLALVSWVVRADSGYPDKDMHVGRRHTYA
ncbi:MAG: hypothetical protein MHM6MM_002232 [Cercozoa sp. M6MM]